MRYFPAFFDLTDKPVLIAGGGELALRKARLLAKAGPRLIFVAPAFEDGLTAEFPDAAYLQRDFALPDLDLDPALMIVATGEAEEDERIAHAARAVNIPVNVVDRPDLCDFTVPSLVERGDLVIGISTGGAAPVFGRRLRERIEALLPAATGGLIDFAGAFREAVAAKIAPEARRSFWEGVFGGRIADLFLSGREAQAREAMIEAINTPREARDGFVHIVGAGPGDPDLLTIRALRVLQEADVVLHDALIGEEILELIRRDAQRIYVGKKKADHSMRQEDIGTLMIRLAREGKRVVRLKGGDPFVFGRGGEELDALREAGIAAQIVPGITAATGCGAAAGVPLTHRDHAQAVTFVTGHAKGGEPDLDWRALAAPGQTLVVYMGVGTAARLSARLIGAGLDAGTPAAIIEKGTLPEQKIVRTRLDSLGEDIGRAGIEGPAILIIGQVAARADGAGLVELADREAVNERRRA